MTQFQESGGEKERLMADLNGYVWAGFQLRGFRQIEPYNRGEGGAIIVVHNERLEFAMLLSFCCLKRHEGEVLSNLQPLVYSISLRFSILVRGTRKRLMKWGLGWRLDETSKCGKVSTSTWRMTRWCCFFLFGPHLSLSIFFSVGGFSMGFHTWSSPRS